MIIMNRNQLNAKEEKKLSNAKKEFEFFAQALCEYIDAMLMGDVQGGNLEYCKANVYCALNEIIGES